MSHLKLVQHFNERFAHEHGFDFRPLLLKKGQVIGLFDETQLSTVLNPIHSTQHLSGTFGYAAQTFTQPHFYQRQPLNIAHLLSSEPGLPEDKIYSITTFDRLCRTVHLLNALELIKKTQVFLLLAVDPRHIIGVSHAHGAYFEEIIVHCGLETKNVVISLTTPSIHPSHHERLINGLNNYRECGYKIALNLEHLISADKSLNFITQLAPDYVSVNAPHENYAHLTAASSLVKAFHYLKELTHSLNGQIILQNVKRADQELLARELGFDLVSGDFYHTSSQASRLELAEYENELELA